MMALLSLAFQLTRPDIPPRTALVNQGISEWTMAVQALDPELEELWDDYRRSLARRGRAVQTQSIYRKAFDKLLAVGRDRRCAAEPRRGRRSNHQPVV